jgi:hypothetical protein
MYEFDDLDFIWSTSDEVIFFETIFDARLSWNQHMFADHLYFWDNLYPFGVVELKTLKTMNDEIQFYLDRQLQERKKRELDEERAKLKKEKIAAKKKLMEELGVKGKVEISAEELAEIDADAIKHLHVEDGSGEAVDEQPADLLEEVVHDDEDDDNDDNAMEKILSKNRERIVEADEEEKNASKQRKRRQKK